MQRQQFATTNVDNLGTVQAVLCKRHGCRAGPTIWIAGAVIEPTRPPWHARAPGTLTTYVFPAAAALRDHVDRTRGAVAAASRCWLQDRGPAWARVAEARASSSSKKRKAPEPHLPNDDDDESLGEDLAALESADEADLRAGQAEDEYADWDDDDDDFSRVPPE